VDGWDIQTIRTGHPLAAIEAFFTKKQSVFQKIAAFVEKFKGVGGKI